MNLKTIFISIFVSIAIQACTSNTDCFLADTVEQIRRIKIDNEDYFLYLRTSGFNEKEFFFELYGKPPTIDDCGTSDTKPISDIHVDTTAGHIKKLTVNDKRLALIYTQDNAGVIELRDIPLEIHGHENR